MRIVRAWPAGQPTRSRQTNTSRYDPGIQVCRYAAAHRNVGDDVTFDEFKQLYYKGEGWLQRDNDVPSGKRHGILNEVKTEDEPRAEACFIDPAETKECG